MAEEVVQDTWLAVVRGVERFEGRSTFKTWLFHILLNRARSAAGREHRAPPLADEDLGERFDATGAWAAPPVPWAEEAEDRLVAQHLAERVRRCCRGCRKRNARCSSSATSRESRLPTSASCSASPTATSGCCCTARVHLRQQLDLEMHS